MKFAIYLMPLIFLAGCVKQPIYQPTYSSSSNYSNNSIPAVQYDSSYKAGCNKANYTNATESYNGAFCYGKKKGSGVATYYKPPSKYEGMFNNDLRDGYGVYTWTKSGDSYAGSWKGGEQSGYGTYTWASDGSYEWGNWINGRQEGEHILSYKDGTLWAKRVYKNGAIISTSINSSTQSKARDGANKAYVDPNIKNQKCKRIGLVEGTDDFNLCIKSLKD